jgi:tRNA modification GTPase
MAYSRANEADIRLFLVDSIDETLPLIARPDDFVVLSKADERLSCELSVSGKTGLGVSNLLQLISDKLMQKTPTDVVAIRERQVVGLRAASVVLTRTLELIDQKPLPFELACQELYFALSELDFVFGKIDIESVLDEIFSSFCLGK